MENQDFMGNQMFNFQNFMQYPMAPYMNMSINNNSLFLPL